MTGELEGIARVHSFTMKLEGKNEEYFFLGRQGFAAKLNFKHDPTGQLQLGLFDVATPRKQTVFRWNAKTGELALAFKIQEGQPAQYLFNTGGKPEQQQAAEALASKAFSEFLEAAIADPASRTHLRDSDTGPWRN